MVKFTCPESFTVADQNVIDRVFELLDESHCKVIVFPLKSIDQRVTIMAEVPLFQLSCKVHHPPTQSKVVLLASVIPLIVIVLPVVVDLKVIAPVYVLVIPAVPPERFIEPYIFNAEDPAQVAAPTRGQAMVKSAQFAVAVIVTV